MKEREDYAARATRFAALCCAWFFAICAMACMGSLTWAFVRWMINYGNSQ